MGKSVEPDSDRYLNTWFNRESYKKDVILR